MFITDTIADDNYYYYYFDSDNNNSNNNPIQPALIDLWVQEHKCVCKVSTTTRVQQRNNINTNNGSLNKQQKQ
jgi:hypothetical protein